MILYITYVAILNSSLLLRNISVYLYAMRSRAEEIAKQIDEDIGKKWVKKAYEECPDAEDPIAEFAFLSMELILYIETNEGPGMNEKLDEFEQTVDRLANLVENQTGCDPEDYTCVKQTRLDAFFSLEHLLKSGDEADSVAGPSISEQNTISSLPESYEEFLERVWFVADLMGEPLKEEFEATAMEPDTQKDSSNDPSEDEIPPELIRFTEDAMKLAIQTESVVSIHQRIENLMLTFENILRIIHENKSDLKN